MKFPTTLLARTARTLAAWAGRLEAGGPPRRRRARGLGAGQLRLFPGPCGRCGCTERTPCAAGRRGVCHWADLAPPLCSACARAERRTAAGR